MHVAIQKAIAKYIKNVKSSTYTDITGGILQATEYLNEKKSNTKTIMILHAKRLNGAHRALKEIRHSHDMCWASWR